MQSCWKAECARMATETHQFVFSRFPTVIIDSIYKVTEGRQSEIFHRHAEGNFDPSCCFTIYHGNHLESLDLITSNPEEARTWITGLKYLMAGISDEDSLAKRQRTHDQYPFTDLSTVLSCFAMGCSFASCQLDQKCCHWLRWKC